MNIDKTSRTRTHWFSLEEDVAQPKQGSNGTGGVPDRLFLLVPNFPVYYALMAPKPQDPIHEAKPNRLIQQVERAIKAASYQSLGKLSRWWTATFGVRQQRLRPGSRGHTDVPSRARITSRRV